MTAKSCRDCTAIKPLDDFYRHNATKDRRQAYCKPCMHERNRRWRERNGEKLADYERKRPRKPYSVRLAERLKREYGISVSDYEALIAKQDGRCAICGDRPPLISGRKVALFVDHCHTTKKVRGLLCSNCNVAIGHMKDDVERLRAAIAYLEES